MLDVIKKLANEFLEISKDKPIRLISHFDTDGITSAAIIVSVLRQLEKKFSLKIVKGLDKEFLDKELKRNEKEVLFFTDLASGSLDYFQDLKNPIFILDHHEIDATKLNDKIKIVNPHLNGVENICGAGLCYLFSKEVLEDSKKLARLAVIGMIGDRAEANLCKLNQQIVKDAPGLEIKSGLLVFSATRPLSRSLEYSTSCYIPGVTGSSKGVRELLREVGIGSQKTLYSLNEEEMKKLVTAVMIRRAKHSGKDSEIIGNLYLMNFFNRKEDARELSVLINACSRLGYSDVALSFCLENQKAKELAQEIYLSYKQQLVSALAVVGELEKVEGNGFLIINARERIKDTIIGTVTSMLSSSLDYEEGTVLIGMAHNKDKIKVSARIVGRGRNLKEVLEKSVCEFEADVGGHKMAAGCLIKREDELEFIKTLRKNLEIEVVKV